ncbi:DUF6973 domain-containing protein [Pseudoxanthomonas winnipegensis]|uniref:DUF6973 domain-containing protein n=1 Tax=Pseudoxanthomonas winnipegensis TaxID=2480810 RepID=UPI00103D2C7F|nr:hypothetical protein [Pseudoxanthomonas winnipegensis]TBV76254.1 hypothetical protein EYC45_03695 [Pseudoxanthomonas winnipegensis]
MKPSGARPIWRRWRLLVVAAIGLAAYPTFVMASVYAYYTAAGLPGGRNGPADAYRHSLASATVAYTLSPRCVDWVTHVMEHDGVGSAARAMDAHNNRIGASIGAAAHSWTAMHDAVRDAVEAGAIDAPSAQQITWLAPSAWQDRLY